MTIAFLIDFSEVIGLYNCSHKIPRTTCCGAAVIGLIVVGIGALSIPLLSFANERRDDSSGRLERMLYQGIVDAAADVTIVVM
tara:strand:+ start:127 stop:375 length:249 start_codon:yes stop_codon:yes gene_type:complete